MYQRVLRQANIHSHAIIEHGARIGENCTIGPFCVVGAGCTIGAGTVLHHGASVVGNTIIGEGCEVHPYAVIGGAPQDKKHNNEIFEPKLIVGNNCVFREHCTVNGGTLLGGGVTTIGDRVAMLAGSHVGHDSLVEDDVVLSNNVLVGGHVKIGKSSVVGGGSAIRQFVNIGRLCMIGGLSVADNHVLPFSLVNGNRGKLRGVNIVGLRRSKEFGISNIRNIQRTLAMLPNTPNLDDTLMELYHNTDDPYVQELCKFGLSFVSPQERRLGITF